MKTYRGLFAGTVMGVLLYIVIFNLFHPFVVSGPSMEPTFHDENLVLSTDKFTKESLSYGDIVVAFMDGQRVIKRIVALPGDNVLIEDGILYVNGEPSEYNFAPIDNAGMLSEGTSLSSDEFILLGDNRNNSLDSRDYGPAQIDEIKYLVTKKLF